MTTREIRIISERLITTTPRPGEISRRVQVTYQLTPRPPSVFWVLEDVLPHWVFRRDNPEIEEIPEAIQEAGNVKLRELIEARERASGGLATRSI